MTLINIITNVKMNEKIILLFNYFYFISLSSFSESDGTIDLSRKNNGEVKDCFETFNRGQFCI